MIEEEFEYWADKVGLKTGFYFIMKKSGAVTCFSWYPDSSIGVRVLREKIGPGSSVHRDMMLAKRMQENLRRKFKEKDVRDIFKLKRKKMAPGVKAPSSRR
jgi:hypothetical protein